MEFWRRCRRVGIEASNTAGIERKIGTREASQGIVGLNGGFKHGEKFSKIKGTGESRFRQGKAMGILVSDDRVLEDENIVAKGR